MRPFAFWGRILVGLYRQPVGVRVELAII